MKDIECNQLYVFNYTILFSLIKLKMSNKLVCEINLQMNKNII